MKISKLQRAMDLKHQLEEVDGHVTRLRKVREAREEAGADCAGPFGAHSVQIAIPYVGLGCQLPIDDAFMKWLEAQLSTRRLRILGELATLGVEV